MCPELIAWTLCTDLHILSVDPTVQRAGVGRRLLQDAIDRAQSENLPLTLESTECACPAALADLGGCC